MQKDVYFHERRHGKQRTNRFIIQLGSVVKDLEGPAGLAPVCPLGDLREGKSSPEQVRRSCGPGTVSLVAGGVDAALLHRCEQPPSQGHGLHSLEWLGILWNSLEIVWKSLGRLGITWKGEE